MPGVVLLLARQRRDRVTTREDLPRDGAYGVQEGLISGFPCTASGGDWSIVQGLDIDEFSRQRIDTSVAELADERDAVSGMGLLG